MDAIDEDLDPFSAAIDALDVENSLQIDYAKDPVRWAHDRAGIHLWSKQQDIIESVRDNPRTVVHSCHNVGKTYTASAVVAWWIDAHPPGEAFVLTTAPTGPQVKALLWREINRLHSKADLPGYTNLTEWYLNTGSKNEMVAFGRKPSEHSEAAFQGFHAKHTLIVMDEGSGVPQTLWDAAESVASNRHSRILAIGNPDLTSGPFAYACRPESPWNVIHVGYHHAPTFSDEEVPDYLHDMLISPEWVEERRLAWGENSALYQAKVLGQFPSGSTDPFRVMDEEATAACRYIEPVDTGHHEAGIDVGGGGDRTVIVERIGNAIARQASLDTPDPMKSVGHLVNLIREWGVDLVKVDVIGIGWGIVGRLKEVLSPESVQVLGVNFAAKSRYPRKFMNVRAEAWWNGRELSRDGRWSLTHLSDDDIAELTTPRYEIADSTGKIKIEPKDKVRERLGRSPDVADAVLLAFFQPSTIQGEVTTGNSVFKRGLNPSGNTSIFGNRSLGI